MERLLPLNRSRATSPFDWAGYQQSPSFRREGAGATNECTSVVLNLNSLRGRRGGVTAPTINPHPNVEAGDLARTKPAMVGPGYAGERLWLSHVLDPNR